MAIVTIFGSSAFHVSTFFLGLVGLAFGRAFGVAFASIVAFFLLDLQRPIFDFLHLFDFDDDVSEKDELVNLGKRFAKLISRGLSDW